MSPPRRNGAPHRDDIASDEQGPSSPAPPSGRSRLKSLVSRIGRRYSGRAPPTGPSFETALSAVGLYHADHPDHAPAVPTASLLDSTVLNLVALPTSPAPSASGSSSYAADHLGHLADHPLRALPRLQTSDIHGPAAPFASALYSVGLVISPAPSAGDSRSYAYAADYSHRGGLVDSTPTSLTALTPVLRIGTTGLRIDAAHASPDALNEARFTRDNVLYGFSFLCLGAIRRTMKDIEDGWNTGFKTFFILMIVVCFGMIGVGVMANTSTRMSETNDMISAVMSRTSWILSSCLLLIALSFFAEGHGFISGIVASLFVMIVMVSAWNSRDPTTATVVSTFFSSCLSKIKAGWRSRSQPILPL